MRRGRLSFLINEDGGSIRAMYISEIKNGATHITGKIEP
jgi:hypothetical protein